MTMAWHDSLNPASALLFPKEKWKTISEKESIIDGIFPGLARAARGIGHINVLPSEDGILREVPLLYRFGNNKPVYLPISVRATATLFGTPNEEIRYEPNKYIDIGTPFKICKDAIGTITCSYPNVTALQIKAICDKSHDIMTCRTRKGVEISSLCIAHRDSAGRLFVEMGAPGILPPELTGVLLGSDLSAALDLDPGNELDLGHDVAIQLDSSSSWIIKAPYDQMEWYCSRTDIETLSRITLADISSVRSGESKIIFHNLTVRFFEDDGSLVSNIPVLRDQTLRDICTMGWDRIATMSKGTRTNFGKPLRIPLLPNNRHIITYFGPKAKTFKSYSFVDVMNDVIQGDLEGKIFIVGSTAPALFDIKAAPHDRNYPAVEVHASLIHSFLTNTFVTRLLVWQDFLIILLVSVCIGFISYLFKPLYSGILTIIAAIVYFLVAMDVFGTSHLWIEIARPVIAILLTFTAVMAYRYITEEKDRKFLQNTFKQYLSPELIDIMYKQRRQPKLGGEEGVRTAYFTDIQGFSTFSEKLGSPTRLVELLNEYLTEMTDTLLKHYGTLDKYEGDAIIAFFGAPMPMEDHAYQACLTALDMQKKLADLRKRWKAQGDKWPQIVHDMRMRIGINTGQIVTGNMGSRVRMNYTMMGDAVNLAARLESASKQYGVFTMISNFTYEMVKNRFVFRLLDKVTVVGKSEPVVLYELIGEKGSIDE
jgi:adenylate cyclase